MDIRNIKEFNKGWIVGDFEPSIIKNKDVEIGLHHYESGHRNDKHYHKLATEINVIIKGRVYVDSNVLTDGDIWITYPYESPRVRFGQDTDLLVIKSPSIPGDKYCDRKDDLWISPEAFKELQDWLPSQEASEEYFTTFGGEKLENYKRS